MFCPLSAKAASKFVVESLVFGAQPGNLFAVDVDLLPEGLDGCRLVQWSRAGSGGAWSPVASRRGHSHVYCATKNLRSS